MLSILNSTYHLSGLNFKHQNKTADPWWISRSFKNISKNVQVTKTDDKTPNKFKSKASEETELESMQLTKRRKGKIKDGLLPTNPKKKPALSTLDLCKLETIYQTIYEMEESCVLKYPSSINVGSSPIIMVCYSILNVN